jgi:hypothetical protein
MYVASIEEHRSPERIQDSDLHGVVGTIISMLALTGSAVCTH